MALNLFLKKSISALLKETEDKKHSLKRTLGPINLTAMGIGAIVGAGFFVLIGQAAANYAGPAVIISFAFAAIICVFSALCYAEFASLIPIAGSAYSYAYATMGEFVAWIIGWGLTLEFLFSPTTVAVGWSAYFVSTLKEFGVIVPKVLCNAPIAYSTVEGWTSTGFYLNLPAMLIVAVIGILISIGVKTASLINDLLVIIKLGIILLFFACGVAFLNFDNLTPFIPENTGVFGQFGWSGILRASGLLFFAFLGFDAVSTLAQEAKNPQKDMPIGMLGSLIASTIIYIIVAVVMLGAVGYAHLNVSDPLAVAVEALGTNFIWLRYVTKIAITIGLTSVILVMLLSQARIFFTMGLDGLLPPIFAKTHPKYKTPFFTSLFISFIAMLMAGFLPIEILANLTVMGALLAFFVVNLGILVLRRTQPDLHRPFKTPLVPLIPLLGMLTCFLQMIFLPAVTWVQLVIFMIFGFIIYFSYGIRHSVIRKHKKHS
jgi:basic amino acid/polyamine antiporter, APA family